MSTTTFHSDTRRLVGAADAALITRFTEALMDADRLALEAPAILHTIGSYAPDGVRAASPDPDRSQPQAWCWEHEREVRRCFDLGGSCAGEVVADHADPTASAALDRNQAGADRRDFIKATEAAITAIDRMARVANRYPRHPLPPADVVAEAGDDWCRSCWRDDKYCEPIGLRPDGQVRVRGLCRWCGDFRTANGFDPPIGLVRRRHRGERITKVMVDAARATHLRANPPKPKGKRPRAKTKR